MLEFGRSIGAEVRFIEYMDVGGATHWTLETVVSRAEILARLEAHYGPVRADRRDAPRRPAERFQLPDGTTFGIIASTTEPFCAACDRSRLTADGLWLLCLYAQRRARPAAAAARGSDRRRAGAADLDGVVDARRPGRRGAAGCAGAGRPLIPDRRAQAGRAPRDAYARRLGPWSLVPRSLVLRPRSSVASPMSLIRRVPDPVPIPIRLLPSLFGPKRKVQIVAPSLDLQGDRRIRSSGPW